MAMMMMMMMMIDIGDDDDDDDDETMEKSRISNATCQTCAVGFFPCCLAFFSFR